MNANQIATADIIDIVFDGRNKLYGAYQLRRNYNPVLLRSLAIVFGASVVFLYAFTPKPKPERKIGMVAIDTIELVKPPEPEKPVEPTPPQPAQRMAEIQYTVPLIKPDKDVMDTIPEVAEVDNKVISTVTTPGDNSIDNAAPAPQVTLPDVPAAVKEEEPLVWTKVENPAEFPGGLDGWRKYLERNINYPEEAVEGEVEAVIRVQFIVDVDGNISNVQALNNPGYGLAEEAVRIIKNGPRWKAAEQNGRKVKYQHIQGIAFRLK